MNLSSDRVTPADLRFFTLLKDNQDSESFHISLEVSLYFLSLIHFGLHLLRSETMHQPQSLRSN